MEVTFDSGSWWAYVLVFLAAAIPVIEVLVVVPAGILAGLAPVPVLLLALAGNLSTVVLVILVGDRLASWWRARTAARGGDPTAGERPRMVRARHLARRWGVPGLGLLAPLTTGSHLAAVAALATGAGQRRVLAWMTIGLVLWSVVVAVATTLGVGVFG